MSKNKITITDDLINEIQKFGTKVSVGMATTIRDELTDSAAYAIDMFYKDYTPDYYKRHYTNFEKNSFMKYYNNPHNSIVRGGVELTPYRMDSIYQDPVEEVFDMVFAGFHGVASGFENPKTFHKIPPVMSPSPLEIIQQKRDDIVKNIENYKSIGIEKAKKESYETFDI